MKCRPILLLRPLCPGRRSRRCGAALPRSTGWRRKPQSEFQTGRVVEQFDPRAMKTGDGRDQAEPETVSRRVAAGLSPVKAPEDTLVFAGGDFKTVIGDREH